LEEKVRGSRHIIPTGPEVEHIKGIILGPEFRDIKGGQFSFWIPGFKKQGRRNGSKIGGDPGENGLYFFIESMGVEELVDDLPVFFPELPADSNLEFSPGPMDPISNLLRNKETGKVQFVISIDLLGDGLLEGNGRGEKGNLGGPKSKNRPLQDLFHPGFIKGLSQRIPYKDENASGPIAQKFLQKKGFSLRNGGSIAWDMFGHIGMGLDEIFFRGGNHEDSSRT